MTTARLTHRGKLVGGALAFLVVASAGVAVAQMSAEEDTAAPPVTTQPDATIASDTTPPQLIVRIPSRPIVAGKPFSLSGKVKGAESLSANGREVTVRQNGAFTAVFGKGAPTTLKLVATDDAGNARRKTLRLKLHHLPPRMHAVHVSAYGWASSRLRRPLLEMIKRGRINTIELDLKDESGDIGYDSKIPLANRIHADRGIYDLREVVDKLHRMNVRVVGRLVAFRDPILAAAAWRRGHRDWVIQTPQGRPYADYGGFTNFAHPSVRKYNIDIAEEAAKAGMDDILYDYVRRPDGPIKTMVFKGSRLTPEREIARFVEETEERLRPYGARLGASVFGIAATRPKEIAQDIARIARAADYIAPMLYPSHWAPGEYNVGNPNGQPYKIVYRSLKDFQKETKGTRSRIIPWIQDFSLGIHYGPGRVRAQLAAARERGIHEWILWDPSVTYATAALPHGSEKKK
jgi:hypothetical protein